MKDRRGFTLVEVLAVVAILMAIIAIIAPKIFKSFKNAGEITYQEQINNIIETSRLYMNKHTNLLPEEDEEYVITINELKQDELIKNDQVLNPKTKEPLTGCIIVEYKNNKYTYEYTEGTICDK